PGVDHCLRDRPAELVHDVKIDPASLLASVAGGTSLPVNSLHHQAVGRVGAGLRAVAWSDDGVVEGLESDDVFARLLGVQWHPELLGDHPAHERLFAWLV